jgi:hypothetical protein
VVPACAVELLISNMTARQQFCLKGTCTTQVLLVLRPGTDGVANCTPNKICADILQHECSSPPQDGKFVDCFRCRECVVPVANRESIPLTDTEYELVLEPLKSRLSRPGVSNTFDWSTDRIHFGADWKFWWKVYIKKSLERIKGHCDYLGCVRNGNTHCTSSWLFS